MFLDQEFCMLLAGIGPKCRRLRVLAVQAVRLGQP